MTASVINALQLDQKSLKNQFITIEENNTSDASFLLSSVIDLQIKNKCKIIFVLFHNTIGHYHAIGQKLGYNLLALQESGDLVVIDILKSVSTNIDLKNLYFDIKKQISDYQSNEICLILENVSNLLLLDIELKDAYTFIHYMRTLLCEVKNLSIVASLHNFSSCKDHNILLNSLKHTSDLVISVSDLKTGKAIDVSGIFTVKWKEKDYSKWNEQSEYHYQLLDRNIKVFAPGYKNI